MDDFIIKWAGRLKYVCLGMMIYSLLAGMTFWAIINLVMSGICYGIEEDLKRMRAKTQADE